MTIRPRRPVLTWIAPLLFVWLALSAWTVAAADPVRPLPRAHAHNDYEHPRPLLDALDHGFCSVEADIHLVDGELLVAHSRREVKPGRTLRALYLEPLREQERKNGGRVHSGGPEFSLLIDLKTDWKETYPVLRSNLVEYADILTTFAGDQTRTNAVRAILSGSRSLDMFAGETTRYAAYDGTLSDLDANPSPALVPWVSASWGATFTWRGSGTLPPNELDQLRSIVQRAHAQGRRVRFWAAPDKPHFWQVLWDAEVDLINTDDLPGLWQFLQTRPAL